MKRFIPFLTVLFLFSVPVVIGLAKPLDTPSAPPDFSISVSEVIASGLDHSVQVTHAGDESGRLFVVEQPGRIRIIQNGSVLPTPFLDIHTLIAYGGERGLLGLAFHPDYPSNGYFFVNYTNTVGDTIIARYQVSSDPNVANPASATQFLFVNQPFSNHNGGQLLFGPDRYLYIGMGDGGSGGDPNNYAQNLNSLLGKMLRIDVDQTSPGKNYAIPPDNPYVGIAGLDEIWSLGLRNPWRFSFDRMTGDMYIGDVGQGSWEEVSFQKAGTLGGLNFGWRCREGKHIYTSVSPCNQSAFLATLTDPITDYSHSEGHSVTGGFVYRGNMFSNLYGTYFFGDYVDGKIWSIKKLSDNPVAWSTRKLELSTGFNVSSFGEDENGELFVTDYFGGKVRRLADTNLQPDLSQSQKSASTPWADPSETITYTLELVNIGGSLVNPLTLTDTLPIGLNYLPGSLSATVGTVSDAQSPTLNWSGSLTPGITVTVKYQAIVDPSADGSLNNYANLYSGISQLATLSTSIFVPRPVITTTHQDFILPGTQPGGLNNPLVNSLDCDICHNQPIYDKWRGSMMSQAGRDPLMWAALAVANNHVPNSGEFCLRCHTPNGWFAGRSQNADGSSLTSQDIHNGISCQTCHRMVDPIASPGSIDEAETIDNAIRSSLANPPPASNTGSGMMVLDPNDRRRGPFSLGGSFPYHSAFQTDFLGQSNDPVTEARLCGTCHNVDNPLLSWDVAKGEFWPNASGQPAPSYEKNQLFPIERTYDEWLLSDFAETGVYAPQFAGSKPDKIVYTCQDCHMPRAIGSAADEAFNPFQRDCQLTGCLPQHDLLGANTWVPSLLQSSQWRFNASSEATYLNSSLDITQDFLAKAATLEVFLNEIGGKKQAVITVTNQTGHKLPTGYPEGRRMWLNLKAYDQFNNVIYESGIYTPSSGVLALDSAIKVYEVKQGITNTLATYLGLPPGPSFHFVLNNATFKDNRIPPRGYTQTEYDQPGLRPVGAIYLDGQNWDITSYDVPSTTVRLRATLYYQTASKEYIEFLKEKGGLDGATLQGLWNTSKSPPEIVQVGWYPNYPKYFPLIHR